MTGVPSVASTLAVVGVHAVASSVATTWFFCDFAKYELDKIKF